MLDRSADNIAIARTELAVRWHRVQHPHHMLRARVDCERASEERGHLSPVSVPARTVTGKTTRCAPRSYPRRGQSINVGPVDTPPRVDKPTRTATRQSERTNQKRRHPSTSNRLVRTKPRRLSSATIRHTQISQTLHIRRPPHTRVHIGEPRRPHHRRVSPIQEAHQPHSHNPTLHRIRRTELPRSAFGPLKHPVSRQRLNRRPMNPRPIQIRKPLRHSAGSTHPQHRTHKNHNNHQPDNTPTRNPHNPTSQSTANKLPRPTIATNRTPLRVHQKPDRIQARPDLHDQQ